MRHVVRHVDAKPSSPSERLILAHRDEIVKRMSEHLVAAILHGGLNTSDDKAIITCLLNTPERFQSRVILNHMDDALFAAKQILVGMEVSRG